MADGSIPSSFHALTPRQRANAILSAARADMSGKLWQATLGSGKSGDNTQTPEPWTPPPISQATNTRMATLGSLHTTGHLDALLATIEAQAQSQAQSASAVPIASFANTNADRAQPLTADKPPSPAQISGPNAVHAPALEAAAQRTGIAAPALAAIIDAEAARMPDGRWNPHSRNPRSSAAGLGQFLSGTWLDMARTPETWLHRYAHQHDMVDAQNTIIPGRRGALLALRYDPAASIEAVADYARSNIAHLRRQGISIGGDNNALARAAYIGHHLGPGDAVRFYNDALSPDRARHLLRAQVGTTQAEQHIARSGDAAMAHRQWLTSYVARHVQPDSHTADPIENLNNL